MTADRLAVFDEVHLDGVAEHEGQTPEQARNLSIRTFQDTCQFEGVGVPAAEDVLAEMNRRRAGRTEHRAANH